MRSTNRKKSIAKTVGAFCVVIGVLYLAFFIFSHDYTLPLTPLACIVLGLVLLALSNRE